MLEQVWNNVFGSSLSVDFTEDGISLTIPRGSQIRIYDLGQELEKVQSACGKKLEFKGSLNEEELIQFTFTLGEDIVKVSNEDMEIGLSAVAEAMEPEEEEAPKTKKRSKKVLKD